MRSAHPSPAPRWRRLWAFLAVSTLVGVAAGGVALLVLEERAAAARTPAGLDSAAADVRGHSGDGYAAAVRRAAPAVVNIFARRVVSRSRSWLCELPQYRAFCERDRQLESSLGSGVVVRPDGYILTNAHVVSAGAEIVVAFNDGRQEQAQVVGMDAITDLAVVKVEGADFPVIERASSEAAQVGDVVLAIGNPFGIGQAVSLGIVSAKGHYGIGAPYDDLIQTDAAVNPGNSGGALVDRSGRLLGINTLIYSRSGGSDGIGFAIPVDRAVRILNDIIKHGEARHGWFGVVFAGAPAEDGLVVARVVRGSPAHLAGLRRGDVLLSINGTATTALQPALRQILETPPGSRLSIRIRRNGAVRSLEATAGLR